MMGNQDGRRGSPARHEEEALPASVRWEQGGVPCCWRPPLHGERNSGVPAYAGSDDVQRRHFRERRPWARSRLPHLPRLPLPQLLLLRIIRRLLRLIGGLDSSAGPPLWKCGWWGIRGEEGGRLLQVECLGLAHSFTKRRQENVFAPMPC